MVRLDSSPVIEFPSHSSSLHIKPVCFGRRESVVIEVKGPLLCPNPSPVLNSCSVTVTHCPEVGLIELTSWCRISDTNEGWVSATHGPPLWSKLVFSIKLFYCVTNSQTPGQSSSDVSLSVLSFPDRTGFCHLCYCPPVLSHLRSLTLFFRQC